MNELLQARESADFVTLAQGPTLPWTTDEEAEDYASDPKAYLLKRCQKFMNAIQMDTNNIMVATYVLPEMTKLRGPGGTSVSFYVPDKVSREVEWQGRVGLLIARGPLAWKSDKRVDFGSTMHEIGEWVCYDRQDGRQISINRVHCRRLKDVDVWGSTDDPFRVY